MQRQLEEFAEAAKGAACTVFGTYGGAMTGLASFAYAGGPKVGAAVTLALGLAQWAAKENCEFDPDKTGGGLDPLAPTGCKKCDGFSLELIANRDGGGTTSLIRDAREFDYINASRSPDGDRTLIKVRWEDRSGWNENTFNQSDSPYGRVTGLVTQGCDGACIEEFQPVPAPPPPYEHTTADGCTLIVNFQSLVQGNDGTVGGLWRIEPGPGPGLRANGGGIISGCNFNPTMYYDGGGSGEPPRVYPIPIPEPPGDDWWKDLLKTALGTAAGNLLASALKELLAPQLPPSEFLFVAPCDKDAEGKPLEVLYQFPDQDYQSRVVSQQAVLMEIMQQHLNWKTPICSGNEGKGDYRTISFISDESSPDGNNRLRKRFRYRSQSSIGLDGVIEHWKDFTFNAGPVCVQHRGSALGSPQVWAASANEGKRVILHAAGEAGIDPNQVGEWTVGGSDNPRYGMPGTMRVNTQGGYYWITARLGENGRPLVGKT